MFVRIWEFHSRDDNDDEFRAAYGPEGAWGMLFRRAAGYLGTELLVSAGDPRRYVTIDRWASADAWQAFLRECPDDYAVLDRACAGLTLHEKNLGEFDEFNKFNRDR